MSEENTEQAVVEETKGQAAPVAEVTSARDDDDLDTLLAEYDQGTKGTSEPTKPEPKAGADHDLTALTGQVKELLTRQQQQEFRQDMTSTIKSVRGELDPEVFDDDFVESFIDAQARKDPRLSAAWTNRHTNPKQFQKVVESIGRNFSKKFGNLSPADKAATEDREAVTAAVRGASTRAPEGKAPNFADMNNREFAKTVKDEYGFDPGV